MSQRGNCWDNAVAESFFNSLKKGIRHPQKNERVQGTGQSERNINDAGDDKPNAHEVAWV